MNRLLIAGYGKMGSWLFRSLKKDFQCAVYETDLQVKKQNPSINFLASADAISEFKPDLLINCASLNNTIPAFVELAPYLPEECILSDIASVKNNLKSYYSSSNRRFASVHPMFGPTFTDMNNPEGRNAYLISESDKTALCFFHEIFSRQGIITIECDFEEHDRLMAKYLSQPVILAMLFAGTGAGNTIGGTTHERYHELSKRVLNEDSGLLNNMLSNPYTDDIISTMIGYLEELSVAVNTGIPVNTQYLLAGLTGENPK